MQARMKKTGHRHVQHFKHNKTQQPSTQVDTETDSDINDVSHDNHRKKHHRRKPSVVAGGVRGVRSAPGVIPLAVAPVEREEETEKRRKRKKRRKSVKKLGKQTD